MDAGWQEQFGCIMPDAAPHTKIKKLFLYLFLISYFFIFLKKKKKS
jgi:hypothetical protein